jgi:hypothetical protein
LVCGWDSKMAWALEWEWGCEWATGSGCEMAPAWGCGSDAVLVDWLVKVMVEVWAPELVQVSD